MNNNVSTERQWHIIDARGKVLGRLATQAAALLIGKHKPAFARNIDRGDYVIVTNAAYIVMTGKKMQQKTYVRHSGYPGGLRSVTAQELLDTHPTRVVEEAIKGMLPHNRLGRQMAKKLKVFAGESHTHQGQLALREKKGPPAVATAKAKLAGTEKPVVTQ